MANRHPYCGKPPDFMKFSVLESGFIGTAEVDFRSLATGVEVALPLAAAPATAGMAFLESTTIC